ncbi:MAG: tetratricopeptide repeat protein, partial [Candidatus Hydrogenedentes bacterium]|nr:tetratricopeptide repeat protein [Candidatus Hydrogenedentota bacterium]
MKTGDAAAELRRARLAYQEQRYSDAASILTVLIQARPNDHQILYLLALALQKANQLSDARTIALRLRDEFADPRGQMVLNLIDSKTDTLQEYAKPVRETFGKAKLLALTTSVICGLFSAGLAGWLFDFGIVSTTIAAAFVGLVVYVRIKRSSLPQQKDMLAGCLWPIITCLVFGLPVYGVYRFATANSFPRYVQAVGSDYGRYLTRGQRQLDLPKGIEPYIRGKLLLLDYDKRDFDKNAFKLGGRIGPDKPSDVGTLGIIRRSAIKTVTYTDGYGGYEVFGFLTLVD